ncbi:MAG: DUF3857 domain-containing protein [Mameliella sp.]|nr:DUF3857 domain-containing protein [Phaeodactylibacter sp.]
MPYKSGICICLLFFGSLLQLLAQKEVKFGQLSQEELAMTVYSEDASAAAVILHEEGEYKIFRSAMYGSELQMRVYRRIKILKASAFDLADLKVSRYNYKDKGDLLLALHARITLPDGTFFELEKDDFYTEESSERYMAYKGSLPNVKEGAIIELEYELESHRMFRLPTWYFQGTYPVLHSEVSIDNQSLYSYATLLEPGTEMETFDLEDNAILYKLGQMELFARGDRFVMKNAPAIEQEAYLTTIEDYRARIRFQLSEQRNGTIVRQVLTSWEETARTLIEEEDFGRFYQKKRYFKALYEAAQPVIQAIEDPMTKAKSIYRFLGDKIVWDDYFGYFPKQSPDELFKKGSGTSADLGIALVALLRAEGFEAYPVLVSTRGHGKMTQQYPIIDQFNHMLVYLEVDGKAVLLDTPHAYQPFGSLRGYSLNGKGWVVNAKRPIWINITPGEDELKSFLNLSLTEEGAVSGTLLATYRGISAPAERSLARWDTEGKYWNKRLPEGCEVLGLRRKDPEKTTLSYAEQLDVKLQSAGSVVNEYLYFQPVLYSRFLENPFQLQQRNYPVDFSRPIKETSSISVAIPEGWTIDYLPENFEQKAFEGAVVFEYKASELDGHIKIDTRLDITQIHFEPEEYADLKAVFDATAEKLNSQIVLRKE